MAEEATELKIDFFSNCPNGCNEKVNFHIIFETKDSSNKKYFFDKNFPHGIYTRLHKLSGTCSECGNFDVTYLGEDSAENFTCIFENYFGEYIHHIIKPIIKRSLADSIENILYGGSD